MEDFFKKFIYTGVGWISITAEKFKKTIEKFVEEEKISEEEGKKIVDEFLKNSETKKEELEEHFKKALDKVLEAVNFAKQKDLDDLKKKVEDLEKKFSKK